MVVAKIVKSIYPNISHRLSDIFRQININKNTLYSNIIYGKEITRCFTELSPITLITLSKFSYLIDNGVFHQSLNSSKVNLKPTVSNSPLMELTKAPTSNMWVPIPYPSST